MSEGMEGSWLEGDGCSSRALMSTKHEKFLTRFGEIDYVYGVVDGEGRDAAYEEFASTVSVYQEQPQLLDPVLELLVEAMSRVLLNACTLVLENSFSEESLEDKDNGVSEGWVEKSMNGKGDAGIGNVGVQQAAWVSRFIWKLANVRGYKVILKFMPNTVDCVETVFGMLRWLSLRQGDSRQQLWEWEYVVLMWSSQLALVPFHFSVIDSSSLAKDDSMEKTKDGNSVSPLAGMLIDLCKQYLEAASSAREMAAITLGKFLTRPDMGTALSDFGFWCERLLKYLDNGEENKIFGEGNGSRNKILFLIPGVMFTLATIFKTGRGKHVEMLVYRLVPYSISIYQASKYENNSLVRKLCIKIVQRGALVCASPTSENVQSLGKYEWLMDEKNQDLLETSVEALVSGLEDKDTIVRWSSAKGIGRIASKLPEDFQGQVVTTVLESLEFQGCTESTWHGGCLALAELMRRNLIDSSRVLEIVPVIQQGLVFEIRRGYTSVGANVRDAASYVCWAMARTHAGTLLKPVVDELSPLLMAVACYDREVNCRRAASAAFQECVGRLGSFPHGIDILTIADYFTVSLRNSSFLEVAPQVAKYPGYHDVFANHLLHNKLKNWDKCMRETSALALAKLVHIDVGFHRSVSMSQLLPLCTSQVLEERHGALCAIAELLPELKKHGSHHGEDWIDMNDCEQVASLIPRIVELKFSTGKGGEVMRSAICRFIQTLSETQIPLSGDEINVIYIQLRENLRHPSDVIQNLAATALSAFVDVHVMSSETAEGCLSLDDLVKSLIHDMKPDLNFGARRGAALSFQKISPHLLSAFREKIVLELEKASYPEEQSAVRDIETRVNALKAMPNAILDNNNSLGHIDGNLLQVVCQSYLNALDDYSTDNRGDIGSWAREAVMSSFRILLGQVDLSEARDSLKRTFNQIIYKIARQSVERISRLRELAGVTLAHCSKYSSVLGETVLWEALSRTSSEGFLDASCIRFMSLCMTSESKLCDEMILGIVYSIGGLNTELKDQASTAMLHTVADMDPSRRKGFSESFIAIWRQHIKSPRLSTAFLETMDVLLGQTTDMALDLTLIEQVVDCIRAEIEKSGDVSKLSMASNLFGTIIGAASADGKSIAIPPMLALIGSRYPTVRRTAAEQLYTALLMWDDTEDERLGNKENAESILGETAWDSSADIVRPARQALASCFGVELPQPVRSHASQ
eukprot:jgi/Picsp_1/5307/NSC_02668-R1_tubulin-specific chaperone d